MRKVVEVALALGLAVPVALAQKPPSPSPSPNPSPSPSPGPTGPSVGGPGSNPTMPISPMTRTGDDRVLFLRGIVATGDGSKVPFDVLVERVCNERIVQQVYAGPEGDFSMQLGSKTDNVVDASANIDLPAMTTTENPGGGVPRHQLQTCELRASASGFRPSLLRLMDLTVTSGNVDVGRITVERMGKPEGKTLNAAAYRAPKDAVKAYEKGVSALKDQKLVDAEKSFEKAVEIYPKYGSAWYELGVTRLKANDRDGAKAAFTQATVVERKSVASYLKLAEMAYVAQDWQEVVRWTDQVIDLDPMGHTSTTGYVVDLDPLNSGEAYFYNAMANYRLGKMDVAEKNALKAEHVDLTTKFPELHLLLAELFSRRGNYGGAIGEIETYMELVPGAKDQERLRAKLTQLEELNGKTGAEKRP